MEETILKVSDNEIEITEDIPEQVIPAKQTKTRINIKDLDKQLVEAQANLEAKQKSKDFDMAQFNAAMAKHDAMIAEEQAKVDKLTTRIAEAEKQGIKRLEPMEISEGLPSF